MTLAGPHDCRSPPSPPPFPNLGAGVGEAAATMPPQPRSVHPQGIAAPWRPVLARLSLPRELVDAVARRAQATGTHFAVELLATGIVDETRLFAAVADELGLRFVALVEPDLLLDDHARRLAALGARHGLRIAAIRQPEGTVAHLIADPALDLAVLARLLRRSPALRAVLLIAPPGALRSALIARGEKRLLFEAQHGLLLRSPEFCAKTVVTAWQGAGAVAVLAAFAAAFLSAPLATMLVFQLGASLGFAACVALRLLAWRGAGPPRLKRPPVADPAQQPVYSVLVALYRESAVLPQLLAALGRLQWPRSKLEIKLVCEADDAGTLAALSRHRLPPTMEVVLVPPGLPRTKPKALAYALPLCSGRFVTLYDAEDRPHPEQLLEAWRRFREAPEEVACLQAPLIVTNGEASALSAMFSFEYAALFRGLLPWLARRRLVLPLGGTSNHFRRAALEEVGGWDAYNVTEDAELGVRLARYGYRTGVIASPTYEDAPQTLRIWLPQRIRWFKGWMQTWLVHMREPRALWRELGPASFLVMQAMSFGMIVSALVHPFFAGSVLYALAKLALTGGLAGGEGLLAAVGLANIAAGYAAFIALGLATLHALEKPRRLVFVVLTPLHWLLLSVAAWAALWELFRRPHHWSKTPHGQPARRRRP